MAFSASGMVGCLFNYLFAFQKIQFTEGVDLFIMQLYPVPKRPVAPLPSLLGSFLTTDPSLRWAGRRGSALILAPLL